MRQWLALLLFSVYNSGPCDICGARKVNFILKFHLDLCAYLGDDYLG